MNIGSQIKALRKAHSYTQASLANVLGVKPTTVASWEQGRNKPLMDKVQKMSMIFNVPIAKIVGEEPQGNLNDIPNIVYPLSDGLEQVTIPIIGTIACGDPITAEENIEGYTKETFEKPVPSGTLFALRCKGHSMEPIIPNGALVTLRSQPDVEDDEIAAVLVDDDNEATLKRVKYQNGMVMLLPENKDYTPIILNKDNPGRIIGKVIHVSWDIK